MLRLFVLIAALIGTSAAAVAADDLPRRKSGLWALSVMPPGASVPMTMQQCVDEKTDQVGATMAQQGKACTSQTKRDGNRIVFDSICKLAPAGSKPGVGATTATTRGVFVGDFRSSYTHETTTTFDPPKAGMKEGVTRGAAQWTGPCTAGMKAGDIMMSNGMKFNVNDYKMAGKK